MVSWHGSMFNDVDQFWKNLRRFSYNNKTVFEVCFIVVYSIEQMLLLWFTYHATHLQDLAFIVSLIAIIVITTFSFHKLVMESRIRLLENDLEKTLDDKNRLVQEMKTVTQKHHELYKLRMEKRKV